MITQEVDYIEQNLKGNMCLDNIANAAYCSPYHFHRIFKRIVGDTPGNYIRKRRLAEAAKELKESRKGILEIAMDYGFESQAAFTYAFKRQFNNPPGYDRKNSAPP